LTIVPYSFSVLGDVRRLVDYPWVLVRVSGRGANRLAAWAFADFGFNEAHKNDVEHFRAGPFGSY
jgi:hypothetical protein